MPGRIIPLVNGEIYHIYNRGSDKRNIFLSSRDNSRFKYTFYYYQFTQIKRRFSKLSKSDLASFMPSRDKKLVEIICYCMMLNHFHFLIRQLLDNGISKFMSQLCNSYTKYFNTKRRRIGPLLQGAFKTVLIESEEQFIHCSRYIHLNPVVSGIVKNPEDYEWSSYQEYLTGNRTICSIDEVLSLFPSVGKYKEFIDDQKDYGTSLEILKHQLIDIEN